eukprot:Plantae.Rhodophyta-Purpureofilum_apyrenoidigerum.ctg5859.p1 GENE.Plantae.Rhodophyta-Purpureofilum_apyrenoidigerum.ctg5859~~Plantae.Rhodophyta-Purpureofilum_apyrenoidigerum.ctg5859.p1  ORF type:complete len:434 (+),score=49.72 Plantae.Rhodophyta-Purpureofilum_apyrenoidigerum.ctg5859:103-1404(+)
MRPCGFVALTHGHARRQRCRASAICVQSDVVDEATQRLRPLFADVDRLVEHNLTRVLDAFRAQRVGPHHFAGNSGYGHGDEGRRVLDEVYADIFGCEAALVRIQFFSGTHAIAAALYGVLRPGDELLSATGEPYDTLEEVIGTRESIGAGSLRDFGVFYREHPLLEDGTPDYEGLRYAVRPETKVVLIQRSCGYSWRPTFTIDQVGRVIAAVKKDNPRVVCLVDNCFGEFVEEREPTHVGADLIAGSLIKNCGGTLAPTGGYVAGRRGLVQSAANRLSAPGVAGGATLGHNRELFQGLFLAPQVVGESLKGVNLVAEVMTHLGYQVNPTSGSHRSDIIQAVKLGSREKVLAFCKCVQKYSPISSYVEPTPGVTSGYGDEVIFADGNFVDGSTLELSADGPLREPYVVFAQGGTHWSHWAIVLRAIVDAVGPAS